MKDDDVCLTAFSQGSADAPVSDKLRNITEKVRQHENQDTFNLQEYDLNHLREKDDDDIEQQEKRKFPHEKLSQDLNFSRKIMKKEEEEELNVVQELVTPVVCENKEKVSKF